MWCIFEYSRKWDWFNGVSFSIVFGVNDFVCYFVYFVKVMVYYVYVVIYYVLFFIVKF